MSFRCQVCHKHCEGSPIKQVIERRYKVYPVRTRVDKETGEKIVIDKGGVGREIAREIYVCEECALVPAEERLRR